MSSRVCHEQRDGVVEDSFQRDDCLAERKDDFALQAVGIYGCNGACHILVGDRNHPVFGCRGQYTKVVIVLDFAPSKNADE